MKTGVKLISVSVLAATFGVASQGAFAQSCPSPEVDPRGNWACEVGEGFDQANLGQQVCNLLVPSSSESAATLSGREVPAGIEDRWYAEFCYNNG